MCVVSMVGDHYRDKIGDWPISVPFPTPQWPPTSIPNQQVIKLAPDITREEFDKLKADVEEMKKLLIRAKIYDEANNEPHCELEEKVALLKRVAELVGVDLSEVFGK